MTRSQSFLGYSGTGPAPVSFAQQRMWFLHGLSPGSEMYNLSSAYRLRGCLNLPALEESLNVIISRHEALRTTFASDDGRPQQVVAPKLRLKLRLVDLSNLPEETRQSRMLALAGEEARLPFDLAEGPLVRSTLLRLHQEDHVLLLAMHHIISDGWSLGIFFGELAALYAECNGGARAVLPELPLRYVDFAAWQRERLCTGGLERQLSYWRERLTGVTALDLPLDYPRPAMQTFSGASISATLPAELASALRNLARSENATLFVTLLAAFQVLLSRHAGQEDVVIGTPMAGRTRGELENLIGLFVNTVVVRTDLSGSPTFRELLRRTKETVLGAYENQDVPFETLIEILNPERDLSRSPLFQVLFNMISFVDQPLTLAALAVERVASPEIRSKFDLTLYAGEDDETLSLLLLYNPDLFRCERMTDWLRQFHNLLWQIVEDPDRPTSHHSLLSHAAAARVPNPSAVLLKKWEGSVHGRFGTIAAKNPDSVSIQGNERWTYRQLDSVSNQLAHYLHGHAIGGGDLVAVYATRCAALVPALLGVLKAGAAFLILDSSYPPAALIERLLVVRPRGWIQLQVGGSVPPSLATFLEHESPVCRLELPAHSPAPTDSPLASFPATVPPDATGPDDLAYAAFTSGTSGRPQAILGTHAPLAHFIGWHGKTFALRPTDRFAMLSGLAHDPLLRDIFAPLSVGGTVCIPSADDMTAPGGLANWLLREKISVLHLTPALVQIIGLGDDKIQLPDLRCAFFAAEALTGRNVAALRAIAPAVTCANFYGATETPQAMASYIVPNGPGQAGSPDFPNTLIPLGQGIDDAQLLVLNSASHLCGVGELGEIQVRTPYLAQGYLGDDALTQHRFIINPFTHQAGDRLYRTGDLGRYLPTGDVIFAGRLDDQVKIRGFRVEPRMVEVALARYPQTSAAAVVAREGPDGQIRLIGYVVPELAADLDRRDLTRFLCDRLPEYMVPNPLVFLKRLPLTPNGKLDRRALPDPDSTESIFSATFLEPQTPTEQKLAQIWSELLSLSQVGAHDNFFELGGHSLLAMRLLSRICSAYDVDLPLRSLFEIATLAKLAAAIDVTPRRSQGLSVPVLKKEKSQTEWFAAPGTG